MKKILFVSCEASGDLHGANIVQELKNGAAALSYFAVGSDKLREAGAEIIYDAKKLSVMGLTEVITKIPTFLCLFKKLSKVINEKEIDLVVLIDSPDFNLRLARRIKKVNPKIKLIYYISPTIWAWRYNRIKIIKKYIDKMLVILPFEENIYRKENIKASFVGHPLIHEIDQVSEKPKGLDKNKEDFQIAIVPGSRFFEVKKLSGTIVRACRIIKNKLPQAKFVVSRAPTIDELSLKKFFPEELFTITSEKSFNLFRKSDCAIVKSGTSTLEAGLMSLPMVIIYRFSFLSYFIGKYIIRIKKQMFGLVNILSGKLIVKELFQREVTATAIASEILKILSDKEYYELMSRELFEVKNSLQSNKTDVAKEILKLL